MDDLNFEDFEQYLVQGEPDKKKKKKILKVKFQ